MTSSTKKAPSRSQLVDICVRAFVPESAWRNRDSAEAQLQLGKAYALLLAGCDYRMPSDPVSDERTIWIVITYKGFGYFDWGGDKDEELVYLPTAARLDAVTGKDWY